jgi:WD40 repeat protein
MSDELNSKSDINTEHPWLGLGSYSEKDLELFWGRDNETKELFRMVKREVLTIIFGCSGVGKTSLLHAGLFPLLRDEHYLPVRIRLDYSSDTSFCSQVKDGLLTAVNAAGIDIVEQCSCGIDPGEETLWEYLHRLKFWDQRNQLITPVLVFDQFEEIFTLGKNQEKSSFFLSQLSDLVENYIPIQVKDRLTRLRNKLNFPYQQQHYKVIFSLREDFVASLEQLRPQMPSVMYNRYSLNIMNGAQALDAILGPGGHLVKREVAVELVYFVTAVEQSRIVNNDLKLEKLEVEPALLSVFCRELNLKRLEENKNEISSSLLTGSRETILENFYERSVNDLEPKIRIMIEDELLTIFGYRDSIAVEDAVQKYNIQEETLVKLEKRRLIRSEKRLKVPRIELVHDLLTKVVQVSRDKRLGRECLRQEVIKNRQRRGKLVAAVSGMTMLFMIAAIIAWGYYQNSQEARFLQQKAIQTAQTLSTKNEELESARRKVQKQLIKANHNLGLVLFGKAKAAIKEKKFNTAHLYSLSSYKNIAPSAHNERHNALSLLINNPVYPVIFKTNFYDNQDKIYSILSFSPDGNTLAYCEKSGEIVLLSLITGEKKIINKQFSGDITSLAFSPDGKTMAFGASRDKIIIWDLINNSLLKRLEGHLKNVTCLSFSPNGKTLASAEFTGDRIIIWDSNNDFSKKVVLKGKSGYLTSLAFSPDSLILAAAGALKGSIIIWDLSSEFSTSIPPKKSFLSKNGHEKQVASILFIDNKTLVSAAMDRKIVVWDLTTGKKNKIFEGHSNGVTSLSFFQKTNTLVSGSDDKSIIFWDIAAGEKKIILEGHIDRIGKVLFSPDGKTLVSASKDKSIILWDLISSVSKTPLKENLESARCVSFSPGGNTLASGVDFENSVILWDFYTGRKKRSLGTHDKFMNKENGHFGRVSDLSFAPGDGATLASVGEIDSRIVLWNTYTGKITGILEEKNIKVEKLSFSSDTKTIATSGATDNSIYFWDLSTRRIKNNKLQGRGKSKIVNVSLSPDKKFLASAAIDGQINLWDLSTGRIEKSFKGASGKDSSVTFSLPEGKTLAFSGQGNTIVIYDMITREKKMTLKQFSDMTGVDRGIGKILFSPDSKVLISESQHANSVIIWDLVAHVPKFSLKGTVGARSGISFSPEGKILVSGSGDVWNLEKISLTINEDINRLEQRLQLYLNGVNIYPGTKRFEKNNSSRSNSKINQPSWSDSHPFFWLEAAERGDSQAMVQLGIIYERDSNDTEAVKWYEKAIEKGDRKGKEIGRKRMRLLLK